MNKKYLIIILVISALLAGLFYYLYTTFPNRPQIKISQQGYRVKAAAEFPEQQVPVKVYRNGKLISEFQGKDQHFIEYMKPGNHNYKFKYRIKNLLGLKKALSQTKQLTIGQLTEKELRQYFDFPSINLSSSQYESSISYSSLGNFSQIKLFRNDKEIKAFSSTSTEEKFIEHVPPGTHDYKIVFTNQKYKNLEDYLYQTYDVEVEPEQPTILSLQPKPLYKGYSSDVTVKVKDASKCKAKLLLHPIGVPEADPTIVKTHQFKVGDGPDYFGRHSKSWTWKEIIFPEPTDEDTAKYDMELKLNCSDYYDSTSTQKVENFPTTKKVVPTSITVSHYNQGGVAYGKVKNNTWKKFSCKIILGDEDNYTLEEKNFTIEQYQAYILDMSNYEEELQYITAICEDRKGRPVTNIIKYEPES